MSAVDSLVEQVAKTLGVDAKVAKDSVTQVISFLKSQLGDSDFGKLLGNVPGVSALAASPQPEASSGLLGGFSQLAGSLLGSDAAGSMDLLGRLQQQGLNSEQISALAAKVADFVQQYAGDEGLKAITQKIPALGALLGK